MNSNSSDDKGIFVITFLSGILAGFLIILVLIKLTGYGEKEDGSEFNKALEVKELTDKNKEFSVRGHDFKTATVCLEGKEMLFAFYRGEPQIVNLNKGCKEAK